MVPGHPVLVLVPQVTPELSLSLVRMALGRVGLSTALCRGDSEPSLGPCPHRHSLLRLCCGHPRGFAPDQGTATPFFSPLIPAQGKPFLDFSVITYRLLCSSQVFRLLGLETECSHRGSSQLPPLSLLSWEKEHGVQDLPKRDRGQRGRYLRNVTPLPSVHQMAQCPAFRKWLLKNERVRE